ncbi:MAG TPA: LppX_LprAFG lipoprotein [Kineosporiaceae bacterium]
MTSRVMPSVRARRPGRSVLSLVVAAVLAAGPWLVSCSGSGSGSRAAAPSTTSAADLVSRAKAVLDGSRTIHFVLSSKDVPKGVDVLLGGEGDAARPDRFSGDLNVDVAGIQAKVSVISIGGTLYARLPFAATYQVTDPRTFHIPDPGSFMSPARGLTQLLAQATDVRDAGTARAGTVVVRQVTAELPGQVVGRILVSADPATQVRATFGIESGSGRLRSASLVGPFFAKGVDSTYDLQLSRFDEPVDIRSPAA